MTRDGGFGFAFTCVFWVPLLLFATWCLRRTRSLKTRFKNMLILGHFRSERKNWLPKRHLKLLGDWKTYLRNSLVRSHTTIPDENSEPSSEGALTSVEGDSARECIMTSKRSLADKAVSRAVYCSSSHSSAKLRQWRYGLKIKVAQKQQHCVSRRLSEN